jgi:hypothetical protein
VPKRRVSFLLAIIFGVVAANRLANVSGSDWPPIKPEELKMTGVPEAPGGPAVILYRQVSGKHAIMPVGLFSSSEKHIFEHTNRTYAVYFEHPFGKTDEINIRMPAYWQVRSLPRPKTMDMKAARYDLAVTGTGNAVQIKRQLKIDFGFNQLRITEIIE